MASLIPGFESDIFISYRQKDNKYDGWVTEFVDNLKRELEATFKEEINVYFDINPHDGILDTHDVNASLKEKLKCLVFIPIISRTYCDPKSFAWDHEFKAFIDYASRDKFGLKIILPSGNMGSRVLPVRIYDLDIEDIDMYESVLGETIRGVDFVYKEPGVNRPLTPDDDEEKNLNNTRYRNQINKTANAIKEILSGLKSEPLSAAGDKIRQPASLDGATTTDKKERSVAAGVQNRVQVKMLMALIFIILCVTGTVAISRIIKLANTSRKIVVYLIPGTDNDIALKNICDAYTETIHEKLLEVKKLTVRPRSALLRYRDTEKPLTTIGEDLKINYLLYGNVRRSGNEIIIWIELTSTKDNRELWSGNYIWEKNEISQNCNEIVRIVARNLNTKLSPDEIKQIETEPTKNPEANLNYMIANAISYNAWLSYTMANKYFDFISFSSAINTYDKAIKEDSLFARAYARRAIARAWGYQTRQLDSTQIARCLEDINKAVEINRDLNDIQIAYGFYYYYCKKDLDKALEYFSIAAENEPENFQPLFYMAMVYRRKGEWDGSYRLIKRLIALDPQEALCLTNIGLTYTSFHNFDSALMFHQKAIDVMPAWQSPYKNKIETLILKNGVTGEARALLDTAIIRTGGNFTELEIMLDIYEGKYSDALKKAEASKPSDYKYKGKKYLFLADINNYLKNPEMAGIYYDSAYVSFTDDLENERNNPEIHSYIGIACAGVKNKGKAVEEGKKAVDMIKYDNLDKSNMIINLARIYTMTGDYDQAVSSIDYLLQTPLNIPSYLSRQLLLIDPVWWPLSREPEYQTLLRKY